MANIKSSKKAIKVIAKKTENNHELKARVKNCIRLSYFTVRGKIGCTFSSSQTP